MRRSVRIGPVNAPRFVRPALQLTALIVAVLFLNLRHNVLAQQTTPTAEQTTAAAAAEEPADDKSSEERRVIVVKLDDEIINPVTARFIITAIERGEKEKVPVVIQLDTPGGLLQSTREIVKAILGSETPVITYVYPNGSRAASAGVFVTLASHVAAMAPSTHIGAAHPVGIGGKWFDDAEDEQETDDSESTSSESSTTATETTKKKRGSEASRKTASGDEVMGEKIMNDTLAWMEAIARERGRNEEWARDAITSSKSIIASKAVEMNVVDLVADDLDDLLEKIDGRTIDVAGTEQVLRTRGAETEYVELSTRQRILNTLANPNIAYILLLAGFALLTYEITHPGLIVPGVAGAVALLLAAFALQMLPTNYAAILLILAGIALIIAEVKFTSYGLLTLGGAVCLFFGSLALFDQPGPFIGVSLAVILPVVLSTVLILGLLVVLIIRTHGERPAIGDVAFIGQIADVTRALNPEGKVFFNGSYWDAVSSQPALTGSKVRILGMDKLRFLVEPLDTGRPPQRDLNPPPPQV